MPPDSEMPDGFRAYTSLLEGNPFAELLASVRFEDAGKGRQGTVLTRIDDAGDVPLVRTTAKFAAPAHRFRAVHEQLARLIRERAALPVGFNNALIECYTNAYATMRSHSDHALDLADDSSIAVFSCYERPTDGVPFRKLIVEPKEGGDPFEVPLAQNSAVVFSVAANRRFRHKIVLDAPARTPENRWLGVTFRTAKTFVRFRYGSAFFRDDGARLTLADDVQRREFYRLRRRENDETAFVYPRITFTISASDLMPPEPA